MYKELNDTELFQKWVKGDSEGFAELYKRYKDRVYSFLLRMTSDKEIAADLLQDTFIAAMKNADQFDKSRSFLSWIYGIAHKRTIDYFRHVKVENNHILDTDKSVGNIAEDPEMKLSSLKLKETINDIIKNLEPAQREVFLLREVGDVSFKDIAEIMNCPLNTALGRMRLALINIRKELKKRGIHGMQ